MSGKSEKGSKEQPKDICEKCNKKVISNDKALSCDVCLYWWHSKCLGLSNEGYEILNGDNTSWYCDNCKIHSKNLRDLMVTMQQNVTKLENRIEVLETTKISKEEATELIKEEIQSAETDRIIEEKIDKKIEEKMENAEATTTSTTSRMTTLQVVQEYMKDLTDVEKRASNLVMHKLPESPSEDKQEQDRSDQANVKEILKFIEPTIKEDSITKMIRLGKKTPDNTRPVLIQFKEKEAPTSIIKNAKKLKDSRWNVSISRDLPKAVREFRNHLMTEAKRNTTDPENFLFRVVGEPGKERIVKTAKKTEDQINTN